MFSRYIFEPLKFVKEFKYARLQTSNDVLKESGKISSEIFKFRCQILCEILNCNIYTAREIISRNKEILNFSHNHFCQNAKFIKNHLKLSDVIEYPSLMTLQPSLLQHRYYSLKELGFNNVAPSYILRYSHILKETPKILKQKGLPLQLEPTFDILNQYLSTSNKSEVSSKLQLMYQNNCNLQKIREMMNVEFFAAKLECSVGKSYQMLHKCAALRIQSIVITDELINILLYKFRFSFTKLQSSLHLLSMHHETAEHFLIEFPEIFEVDTLFLVRKVPLLLKQEYEGIREMEVILREFDISKDQLICCPKILLISPDTLKKRLSALCNSEDLAVLKSNKKFLWLVYYFSNLSSRLKYLKAENMPCSINMFTSSKNTFEKYLLYNNTRTCIRETYVYLTGIFKMTEKDIFNRLRHCSHIQTEDQNFSTLNCRKVIEYLLLHGVTKEQIFNGLEIVFYDIDTVKMHFKCLRTHPQCQPYEEWVHHFNFIQLLIYTIEVSKYHAYDVETNEQDELFLEFSS